MALTDLVVIKNLLLLTLNPKPQFQSHQAIIISLFHLKVPEVHRSPINSLFLHMQTPVEHHRPHNSYPKFKVWKSSRVPDLSILLHNRRVRWWPWPHWEKWSKREKMSPPAQGKIASITSISPTRFQRDYLQNKREISSFHQKAVLDHQPTNLQIKSRSSSSKMSNFLNISNINNIKVLMPDPQAMHQLLSRRIQSHLLC